MERLVGEVHLDQHIARKKLALGIDLATAPHFRDLLGRHQHLLEQVLKSALLGLLADGFGDLLLEVRIGVNDVPAHAHDGIPRGSSVNTEQGCNGKADDQIRNEEEQRRDRHHDEHHDGGDHRFATGRPCYLGRFAAYFLQKFERAESHSW